MHICLRILVNSCKYAFLLQKIFSLRQGLIFEGRTTQELTQQGCWRDLCLRNRFDIFQELQQAVGFGMFRTVLRHLLQQGFCLTLDNSQFEKHGCIEHGVGILLIGEDPLVFTSTD